MTTTSVQHALEGRLPVGGEVTVRGWVRTRRDSKAGLSFVNVSDGSCFAPIQVVAAASLPNYESEVKRLTAGCAVVATGTLAQSQGQGQAVGVHVDPDPVLLEYGIAVGLPTGQFGQVAPARAAGALDPETQPERFRRSGQVAADAGECGGGEDDGHGDSNRTLPMIPEGLASSRSVTLRGSGMRPRRQESKA